VPFSRSSKKGDDGRGRVTGLGGVFFKGARSERMYAWYQIHLGLERTGGEVRFQ
jgi:hypothetical protein